MAKKKNPTKRAKRKAPKPPICVEPDCTVNLEFTRAVSKEPETIRRLAHRVVEMLAESDRAERLSEFVTDNLAILVNGIVIEKVTALITEARAAAKAVARG